MSHITLDRVKGIELRTPIGVDDVKKLNPGDIIYVSGQVFSMMEASFMRAVEKRQKLPIDTDKANAMFIGGGHMKQIEGKWTIYDYADRAFPTVTTGMRYEKWVPPTIRRYNIRVLVAKDGMSDHEPTIKACRDAGCITASSFTFPPKVRTVPTFKRLVGAYWTDLSQPIILSEVEKTGPFVVNIDTRGSSYYRKIFKETAERKERIYEKRGLTRFKYISLE